MRSRAWAWTAANLVDISTLISRTLKINRFTIVNTDFNCSACNFLEYPLNAVLPTADIVNSVGGVWFAILVYYIFVAARSTSTLQKLGYCLVQIELVIYEPFLRMKSTAIRAVKCVGTMKRLKFGTRVFSQFSVCWNYISSLFSSWVF